jgi:hypothetical protein
MAAWQHLCSVQSCADVQCALEKLLDECAGPGNLVTARCVAPACKGAKARPPHRNAPLHCLRDLMQRTSRARTMLFASTPSHATRTATKRTTPRAAAATAWRALLASAAAAASAARKSSRKKVNQVRSHVKEKSYEMFWPEFLSFAVPAATPAPARVQLSV